MKKAEQTKIFPAKPSYQAIKTQIDNLAIDRITKLALRIGFLSLGLGFLILALAWFKLPPEVPLLYSQPYGESQLISVWGLWLLPITSLIVELISIRSAGAVIEEDKLLAQILTFSGSIVAIMGLIGLIRIILLVI